jgi:hypothetical protein
MSNNKAAIKKMSIFKNFHAHFFQEILTGFKAYISVFKVRNLVKDRRGIFMVFYAEI